MNAAAVAKFYLDHPSPVWDVAVTQTLVDERWNSLGQNTHWTPWNYNTAGYILDDISILPSKTAIESGMKDKNIYIEASSFELLKDFYKNADLCPYPEGHVSTSRIVEYFRDALRLLDYIKAPCECVHALVRSIIVLKPASLDTDVSYSHPEIPFSIFISCCGQSSNNSAIRLLEAILHEAMHLQLSLIEHYVTLVNPSDGNNSYYSPWRGERRPAGGVLHGLYVFRAIYEFFTELSQHIKSESLTNYLNRRREEIMGDIKLLTNFPSAFGLTAIGGRFAQQLVTI